MPSPALLGLEISFFETFRFVVDNLVKLSYFVRVQLGAKELQDVGESDVLFRSLLFYHMFILIPTL
jgi:hypothetical protein